jgi:hypothetical protein
MSGLNHIRSVMHGGYSIDIFTYGAPGTGHADIYMNRSRVERRSCDLVHYVPYTIQVIVYTVNDMLMHILDPTIQGPLV